MVQLLRSLPIIGPWTNKQRDGDDDDGGRGGQSRGFRDGRFNEEEFAVAPADLLAFDEVSTLFAPCLGVCTFHRLRGLLFFFRFPPPPLVFSPLLELERLPDI